MKHLVHKGDLPKDIAFGTQIAVDTETMGLCHMRDRLCLVQLSNGDGTAHLVQIPPNTDKTSARKAAPNLCALLTNPKQTKLFHYARFDMGILQHHFGVNVAGVYCTKIASKLARTYTNQHGLKALLAELLDMDISKQQQSSDWGAEHLSKEQIAYAATDVLYLHQLRQKLDSILIRENRAALAQACFDFLPHRVALDSSGWHDDIFIH